MKHVGEFSLILKPSTIPEAGVGVFAAEDIAKGTIIFRYEDIPQKVRNLSDVPKELWGFGVIQQDGSYTFPVDFNKMERICYMNHSFDPNVGFDSVVCFANRDIKKGEEILMDYNDLGEPDHLKEDFYKVG